MCDYSLHGMPTRLAQDGEELVTHRFQTGTIGLASPAELEAFNKPAKREGGSVWRRFVSALFPEQDLSRSVPAVCVPPGARLLVQNFSSDARSAYGCAEQEQVVFDQLNPCSIGHRDCIRLSSGKQVLLQSLRPGLRVQVLSIEAEVPLTSERDTAEVRQPASR
jgi:hypothetical protein